MSRSVGGASGTRVVVTGIGLTTPLGPDRESSWQGLLAGRSATRRIDELDGAIGAPYSPWPADSPAARHAAEPVIALAVAAAHEALTDARLDPATTDLRRFGCVIGTSKGGMRSFARLSDPEHRLTPADQMAAWLGFLPHSASTVVSDEFGLLGPRSCPVAACATGLLSVQRGVDLIHEGACDYVLAGSSDASLQAAVLGSFQRLGVLSKEKQDPARACRPFDRDRSGFVVGEGAAVLVLERSDTAIARGRVPYAEWLAGGLLSDVAGLTALDPHATALTRLIGDVLLRAGCWGSDLDYINLHGTGTRPNDACETRALRAALGDAVCARVACSGLKGGIGHLLGAAGSVETAAMLLALRDGMVPPTIHLTQADPDCDLDYTPGEARSRPLRYALKLSLGFGGHLAATLVRRWEE